VTADISAVTGQQVKHVSLCQSSFREFLLAFRENEKAVSRSSFDPGYNCRTPRTFSNNSAAPSTMSPTRFAVAV